MSTEIDWALIKKWGRKLGASKHCVTKWQQRGAVPYKWRGQLVRAAGGAISLEQLDSLDTTKGAP